MIRQSALRISRGHDCTMTLAVAVLVIRMRRSLYRLYGGIQDLCRDPRGQMINSILGSEISHR